MSYTLLNQRIAENDYSKALDAFRDALDAYNKGQVSLRLLEQYEKDATKAFQRFDALKQKRN